MDNRHFQIHNWAKANVNSKSKRTASLAKTLMSRHNYTYGGLAEETITNTKLVGNKTHIRTNAYSEKYGQGGGIGVHFVFDSNDKLVKVSRSRGNYKKK